MSIRTDSEVSEEIDFIELLPPEMREKLLLSLDHRSLLNCCCVSKRWNEVITSHHHVWKQACLRMSIRKKVLKCYDGNWKKLFLQLLNRSRQFETSQCFIEKKLIQTTMDINTIYYHNGKIATGSDGRKAIMIWDCATKAHLRTIQYKTNIISIKFDDNIIMAAFDHKIMSWDLMTGGVVARYQSHDFVYCFDYLTDARLIVAGNYNATNIWSMSGRPSFKIPYDHPSIIMDVMIRPYPCKQEAGHEIALILSMDQKQISVKKLSLILLDDAGEVFGVEHMFSIPLSHSLSTYEGLFTRFPTFFLHFDGDFLYFPDRSHDGRTRILCVYDFIGKYMARKIDMLADFEELLGVGKRYAAMIISRENKKYFSVVDIITNKKVIRYEVPEFRDQCARSFHNIVCIGETSWLDGLDGINDKGLVYAGVKVWPTRVFALEWTKK